MPGSRGTRRFPEGPGGATNNNDADSSTESVKNPSVAGPGVPAFKAIPRLPHESSAAIRRCNATADTARRIPSPELLQSAMSITCARGDILHACAAVLP
jgi:hypothetical protein